MGSYVSTSQLAPASHTVTPSDSQYVPRKYGASKLGCGSNNKVPTKVPKATDSGYKLLGHRYASCADVNASRRVESASSCRLSCWQGRVCCLLNLYAPTEIVHFYIAIEIKPAALDELELTHLCGTYREANAEFKVLRCFYVSTILLMHREWNAGIRTELNTYQILNITGHRKHDSYERILSWKDRQPVDFHTYFCSINREAKSKCRPV